MGDNGQERQIKQMVAFILQEAEEKCKEIKIKVSWGVGEMRSRRWMGSLLGGADVCHVLSR